MKKTTTPRYRWRKLASAKWEDAWVERLTSVADRLAITSLPCSKSIRLEAFELTKAQATALKTNFGGDVTVQRQNLGITTSPRPPIRIRQKLLVVSDEKPRASLAAAHPRRPQLLVPAGLAFGTGEHATTSTCLRLLADLAPASGPWSLLDLGCGTGILALAGRLLGACPVLAGDFDTTAVTVAKQNLALNRLDRVTIRKLDVLTWNPDRKWQVVAANMFSELLIESAPKLARCVAPGGHLLFSGVLRSQEKGVVAAFKKQGFSLQRIVRKGKWVTGLASL